MDEDHLLAAVRYIALNPVKAKLVGRARDWPWASTRALLCGRDDELVTVAPALTRVPDCAALIASEGDGETEPRLDRAATIGRPLGAPEWIAELERRLGRPPAPRKRGRKPKADPATRGQKQLFE